MRSRKLRIRHNCCCPIPRGFLAGDCPRHFHPAIRLKYACSETLLTGLLCHVPQNRTRGSSSLLCPDPVGKARCIRPWSDLVPCRNIRGVSCSVRPYWVLRRSHWAPLRRTDNGHGGRTIHDLRNYRRFRVLFRDSLRADSIGTGILSSIRLKWLSESQTADNKAMHRSREAGCFHMDKEKRGQNGFVNKNRPDLPYLFYDAPYLFTPLFNHTAGPLRTLVGR